MDSLCELTNGKSDVEVPVRSRVVADDLEAIKALIILAEGIGWLPDFLAADAVVGRSRKMKREPGELAVFVHSSGNCERKSYGKLGPFRGRNK